MSKKQYCLTCELNDDKELIALYEKYHQPGEVWPEVIESIRASGIEDMQIYRLGTLLVMVLETDASFSFEAKAKMDSANPKVQEWERLMERFQIVRENEDKWKLMLPIFGLNE